MSFIISTMTLSAAWQLAQDTARQIKATSQAQRASSNAGMTLAAIATFEGQLRAYRTRLLQIAALPGLAAYVGALADTPGGYNVANEFNAMVSAIEGTITWIRTNSPKDANGFILAQQWALDMNSSLIDRSFTGAELAGYRAVLDTLLAALG